MQGLTISKPQRDLQDHFYISWKNRYAFHTVGKAANSTVKQIFYKFELQGTRYAMPSVHDRMASPLLNVFQLRAEDLERVFYGDDVFRFTFVRNPFSRILSCYLDRIQDQRSRPYRELVRYMGRPIGHAPSFAEFVEAICSQTAPQQNNHWRVQYYDTMRDALEYHFIGRQETFATDIAYVYRAVTGNPLPPEETSANASPSQTSATKRVLDYWTPDLIELFVRAYQADFEMFRYPTKLGS